MAETHLQVNYDGSISERKTNLLQNNKEFRKQSLAQLFSIDNWQVTRIDNEISCLWKIIVKNGDDELKLNVFVSTVRDEKRQADEFKSQFGTAVDPNKEENGWINIPLGIYVREEDEDFSKWLLVIYNRKGFNFASNPSVRGVRTWMLHDAQKFGLIHNPFSIIFRSEFIYYAISIINKTFTSVETETILKIDNNKDTQYNNLNYLRAIRTKPFLLLAGISGTGKSRIVRKLAQATVTEELQKKYDKNFKSENFSKDRWELHRPANFELIQVKPNWHNSMDVVGYLSNIPNPHYVFTPFINFIIKAWQNTEVPFFLCLDEMNLAPVEEYFAEFLSAIESRDKQDGQYVTDPIIKPFNEFGDEKIADSMIDTLFPNHKASQSDDKFLKLKGQLLTKGLSLPPNLIVIGTVNMDETTFSFSRKVLDRAMSLEMNEVNYDAFISGDTDEGLKELVENLDDINELLVDRPIQAKEVMTAIGHDAGAALGYLKRINMLLESTPFKLGYRAANEAMLYLNASYDFGYNDWREAMDQFTLMKILSRIEGDTNKLRIGDGDADQKRLKDSGVRKEEAEKFGQLTLLTAMRVIIEDELKEVRIGSSETDAPTGEDASIVETSEISLPKPESRELESIKKLDSMISQLERERFVSYWN